MPSSDEWHMVPGFPDQRALYRDGRHCASYDTARDVYRIHDPVTGEWGEEETPPWKPAKKDSLCAE